MRYLELETLTPLLSLLVKGAVLSEPRCISAAIGGVQVWDGADSFSLVAVTSTLLLLRFGTGLLRYRCFGRH